MRPVLTEEQKRLIRESLVYALHANVANPTVIRNVIADFFVSLNRKGLLTNRETEEIIREAYEELTRE